MKLINAEISGYGRLVNTKVNLDSKLIAIVGPNEAGKTTLLKALAYIDSNDELNPILRSRSIEVDGNHKVVRLRFELETADKALLNDLNLERMPTWMTVSRSAAGGGVNIEYDISLDLDPTPIRKALPVIQKAFKSEALLDLVSTETIYNDPGADTPQDYRAQLGELIRALEQGLSDQEVHLSLESMQSLSKTLADVLIRDPTSEKLLSALEDIHEWLMTDDPTPAANVKLWDVSPNFLEFTEADRELQSTYNLDDELSQHTPSALKNLCSMANLQVGAVLTAQRAGDIAVLETLVNKANVELKRIFTGAWKQSNLTVQFKVDGTVLRVLLLENDVSVTPFHERSAGLRMFVALIAFLANRSYEAKPILLIDEAEMHMHIDAQADLITMFVQQDQAAKIIYTTHSPACLPPDLGVGVRIVTPIENTQTSIIQNNFWTSGAGFSPLMMAMGAGAVAFTPARCVVLAEGATEMILLPTLLRYATGLSILPYQIAPGISEISPELYETLDFEAAKVAYLVDGDPGGRALKSQLEASGVPSDHILVLPVPGVENLIESKIYRQAMTDFLESSAGREIETPNLNGPKTESWARKLESWARKEKLNPPSKIAVATHLIENNQAIPSKGLLSDLKKLHEEILKVLNVRKEGD